MQIHVATSNAGKLRDFAEAAASNGIRILPLPGLAGMPEPPEDAPDFAGNAALKAIAYSLLAPGLLVLADDSGLEVHALNGQPGVRSARFADDLGFQPDAQLTHAAASAALTKDERNNLCLLSSLQKTAAVSGLQASPRARFVCALALARDGQVLHRAAGIAEGEILTAPRGNNGFGYDPLFFMPELGKSMAELSGPEKWKYSHRGQAFRALLEVLRDPVSTLC